MEDWTGKDLLAHMAWSHDHSVVVIEGLRAGRQPCDGTDPANTTDAFNERAHRDHLDDPPAHTAGVKRVIDPAAGGARACHGRGAIRRRSLAVVGRGCARRDDPVGFLAALRRASRAPRAAFAVSSRNLLEQRPGYSPAAGRSTTWPGAVTEGAAADWVQAPRGWRNVADVALRNAARQAGSDDRWNAPRSN